MGTQKWKVPILMYHSISHNTNPRFRQFTVSPASFTEQMAYLHQHAYTPITVSQYVSGRKQGMKALPEQPVVITFDDGFADFFTAALPVLKRYHFTATLYVSTAYVNETSRWLRFERETTYPMVTWAQLAEICANNIECGAHSHSHPQLDMLPAALVKEELQHSKNLLETHLKQKVSSLAYPFGYHTARVRQLARDIGYTSACAVGHALSSADDDPFALARLMVSSTTNQEAFVHLLRDQHVSPSAVVQKIYMRSRTPIWRLVRTVFQSYQTGR